MSTFKKKCDDCRNTALCRSLLGVSYSSNGPCDWEPSRWVLAAGAICPACRMKYGHDLGCEYVAECVKKANSKEEPK